MSENISLQRALVLFERAYRQQMKGNFSDAIVLYKRSIQLQPTAEAHTFLGWTYSMLERYEEAIDECKLAIEVDPEFGNPYNDIGSYLIAQGHVEEALPWLEQATQAERYESPQFPYMNMGQAHEINGQYRSALESYDKALEIDPTYINAHWAKYALIGQMN